MPDGPDLLENDMMAVESYKRERLHHDPPVFRTQVTLLVRFAVGASPLPP